MPDKIGVLFLHSQPGFAADSTIHAHIVRCLDRERFTVHVACTAGDGSGKPPALARFEQIPDVRLRPTHFAPGFRQRDARTLLRSLGAAARFPVEFVQLRNYIVAHGIRIIHGTDRPRDATYAVVLGRLTGAKSIVHVHVKWSDEYSAPAKWGVRSADGVFGISRYVTQTIVAMGKAAPDVYTVPNCVDPSAWDPLTDGSPVRREYGIPEKAPLLVSVSRLFSWKGQRELLRALAVVQNRVPDVRLLIVGADEPYVHGGSFTAELRALAGELGVAERVVFTGPRSDIPRIMAACDLYTMPSFEEPFGLVFLEAMAMKKPVIALNNGGTPEVVEHGRSGMLSEPGDIDALATNIVTLLQEPELARRMGEHGRARVDQYFNARRMADDAAGAYESILRDQDARTA